MPIHNQLCGLAVMVMLLYMFLRQERLGIYTERIFLRTLVFAICTVVLDTLSIVALCNREMLPAFLVEAVCKAYVVSLVWSGCLALLYILTDLYREQEYFRVRHRIGLVTGLESLLVILVPIGYHVDGYEIYTEGPSVLLTYLFCFIFLFATMFVIVRSGKRIEYKRKLAVIVWMGTWVVAALVQFMNNELLLVGFSGSLGMLALYCILENPENNIDHKFGCFHTHALTRYLEQCFERKVSKSVLFLSINNRVRRDVSMEEVDDCLRRMIEWLKKNADVKIFKNIDRELAVVFSDMSEMSKTFAEIQETFYYDHFYNLERWKQEGVAERDNFPETLFILFPDTSMLEDMDEFMLVHQTLYTEHSSRADSLVCYVNQQVLEKIRLDGHIAQEIRRALDEDRVEVFFQPIYEVRTKNFASAEALVRIRRADGSYMSPGFFIPVAETNGLIDRLGERVFEKVCAFLRDNDPVALGIHYLEVNLSVAQCEQRNLAARYLEIMKRYGTSPMYINLEITETGTLQSKQTLLGNMNRLIREGVTFSLDDFGNGQSNLDYMIDMPVSVMKLDMNMIKAYFEDIKARTVVQAAIRMAHELDLFIVAEGVETETEFAEMAERGVDYIQGYYFSKPLPVKEYIAFLQVQRAGLPNG